jgi:hypothetical protein
MTTRERGPHSARAIYGTILVLAVVAAVSGDDDASATYILFGVLITSLVFWIAHMYAELLTSAVNDPSRSWRELWRAAARSEWPLMEAALAPAVPLLLGAVGVLSRDTAVNLAYVVGLLDLFGWGIAIGRALDQPGSRAVLTGLVNVALGAVVVVLKALVHH